MHSSKREEGMKAGVRDSEVFLMFLTNSLLSRPFCLKEIGQVANLKRVVLRALCFGGEFDRSVDVGYRSSRWRED